MDRFHRVAFSVLGIVLGMNINAQAYKTGHVTVKMTDETRNNRRISAEVYYPSDLDGGNVPVSPSSKFPVLCFGHGFVMKVDAYNNIRDMVVPQGFIIAFPKTEKGMHPSHLDLAKDLDFVLRRIKEMGQDRGSLFFNSIAEKSCIMGHSMGGGAAVLATQMSSAVSTMILLASYETKPSAIDASKLITIPSLIFGGENDCVTPPEENQLPVYKSLKSTTKAFILIRGGDHCQMADSNFLCRSAESTCRKQKSISMAQQHDVIKRFLVPWLKWQLKGSIKDGEYFNWLIENDPDIKYQKSGSVSDSL
jgi:predicted dienelactone hydrolase